MKNVDIILNRKCNLNCIFCEQNNNFKIFDKSKIPLLISVFLKKGFGSITFSWWEPTLDKNLLYYANFAQKVWYKKIKVQTNLTLLNRDDIRLLISKWITHIWTTFFWNNFNLFQNVTNIRRKEDFDKYIDNISFIKKIGNKLIFEVDTILNQFIIDDLENVIKFLLLSWVSHINFKYPFSMWSKKLDYNLLYHSETLLKSLNKKNFSYNILYIPICYLKWFEKKVYNFRNDYIYDWTLFSLKSSVDKLYKKIDLCVGCKYIYNCFWFEK
jgi:sulfatase maturation enzyme AslB (radical SAM superfamily)